MANTVKSASQNSIESPSALFNKADYQRPALLSPPRLPKQTVYLSCYAVGSTYGTLDVDEKILRLKDIDLTVSFNKSFSTWVSTLSDQEKEDLKNTPMTYAALPKTLKYSPYISYEIIGLNKLAKDVNEYISVLGKIIYHDLNYNYVLVKVFKGDKISFILKIDADMFKLFPENGVFIADKSDKTSPYLNYFVQFNCKRQGNTFLAVCGKLLASPTDKVVLNYSTSSDYISANCKLIDFADDLSYMIVSVEDPNSDKHQSNYKIVKVKKAMQRDYKLYSIFSGFVSSKNGHKPSKESILKLFDSKSNGGKGYLLKVKARLVDQGLYDPSSPSEETTPIVESNGEVNYICKSLKLIEV